MLEKAFCSNIAPSLSSGNHLFYKAEYMGQSCPNQVWAITFDWSALATWNKHFWTAFWKLFSGIPHLPGLGDVPGARCRHMAPEFSGARCSWLGQFRPMYCKIGGSQNLMKERYLSKTPNVRSVWVLRVIRMVREVRVMRVVFWLYGLVC